MAVMATIAVANCKATFIVKIYLLPLIARSKNAAAVALRYLEDLIWPIRSRRNVFYETTCWFGVAVGVLCLKLSVQLLN